MNGDDYVGQKGAAEICGVGPGTLWKWINTEHIFAEPDMVIETHLFWLKITVRAWKRKNLTTKTVVSLKK